MRLPLSLLLLVIAAEISAQFNPTPAAQKLRASVMPMAQRRMLAEPLLEIAEKKAAAFSDLDRSLLLYRVAGGWMPLDRERSAALYREAFHASLQIDKTLRPALQHMILDEAVPLMPYTLLELAPQADKDAQRKLYYAVMNFAFATGEDRLAAQAVLGATDHDALTSRMAANLMATVSSAERPKAFRVLTAFYRAHPLRSSWEFSGLVSQFYASLPREDVSQPSTRSFSRRKRTKHSGASAKAA